jgi:uncharacterized membrane protein
MFILILLIQIIFATLEPCFYKYMVSKMISPLWYFYQSFGTIFLIYLYNYYYPAKKKFRQGNIRLRIKYILIATILTAITTISLLELSLSYEVSRFIPIIMPSIIFLIFVWGYFLFNETFDYHKIIGGSLLLIGIYIVNMYPIKIINA